MKLDSKLAIASFVLLGAGISLAVADMKYGLNLGIVPGVFMLGYVVLFTLFLYFNHEIAKTEEPEDKTIGEYRRGAKIWGIAVLAGIAGAFIGFASGSDLLMGGGVTLAGIALCPLVYCLIGWDDIRRRSKG